MSIPRVGPIAASLGTACRLWKPQFAPTVLEYTWLARDGSGRRRAKPAGRLVEGGRRGASSEGAIFYICEEIGKARALEGEGRVGRNGRLGVD